MPFHSRMAGCEGLFHNPVRSVVSEPAAPVDGGTQARRMPFSLKVLAERKTLEAEIYRREHHTICLFVSGGLAPAPYRLPSRWQRFGWLDPVRNVDWKSDVREE